MNPAAEGQSYLIVTPGKACSLQLAGVSIKSYRLLAPGDQLEKLVADASAINVDVCECFLMPGNRHDCALKVVKEASSENLRTDQIDLLAHDRNEFIALYMALQSNSSAAAAELASQLLRAKPSISASASGTAFASSSATRKSVVGPKTRRAPQARRSQAADLH